MKIFHVSAECYPAAKVGGLADVVGSLPKYLNRLGHDTTVVIPHYTLPFFEENTFEKSYEGMLQLGGFEFSFEVLKEQTNSLGFELYTIAISELFDRPKIYAYEDDTERFLSFQIAFLNWIVATKQKPDSIHCHDHHTALIPFMVQNCLAYTTLKNTPTIITIHSAQYQGAFNAEKINYLPAFDETKSGLLEWNGRINPLASAVKCAWKITTVSPSYLDEIITYANGLENLLRYEREKSIGILNGIDTEVWNPDSDPMIHYKYNDSNFEPGKNKNKEFLCEQFNLNSEKPLFVFIGRFVPEKGADLLTEACSTALNQNAGEINILIIGSGNPDIERSIQGLKNFYFGHYNYYIGYNEQLSHLAYAGADFLLMPSRVEPCGLNQMYALRYGTIPIVRRIGGLKDTVLDMGDGGFGLCHDQTSIYDINHSIKRAIELFGNPKKMNSLIKVGMEIDHSWNSVAEKYTILYKSLIP